jgi:hypothetical protein
MMSSAIKKKTNFLSQQITILPIHPKPLLAAQALSKTGQNRRKHDQNFTNGFLNRKQQLFKLIFDYVMIVRAISIFRNLIRIIICFAQDNNSTAKTLHF